MTAILDLSTERSWESHREYREDLGRGSKNYMLEKNVRLENSFVVLDMFVTAAKRIEQLKGKPRVP